MGLKFVCRASIWSVLDIFGQKNDNFKIWAKNAPGTHIWAFFGLFPYKNGPKNAP